MMKRLIILLTGSPHDRGLMLQGNIKDYETIYVDCDGAQAAGKETIDTGRLLCVVLWKEKSPPAENTARIVTLLDEHKGKNYETVVGVHNLGYYMDKALDVPVVEQRHPGVTINQYTASQYGFLKTWSRELSKVGTDAIDAEYVRHGFDTLFGLLKKGLLLTPARRISLVKHRLSNLFLPVDNDLHGLHETGFAADYWKDVVEAYAGGKAVGTLREAAQFIHATGEVQDTVEKVCHEACHDFPAAKGEIEARWKKVQGYLSANGEPSSSDVKVILEDLQNPDKLTTVRSKCGKYNNDFHVWFVSLMEALEELRGAIPEEVQSVPPDREAARG